MAVGNVTEQVAIIGKIAAEGDIAGVAKARGEMVKTLVLADPLSSVHNAAAQVNGRIAYMAGYLPADLGNEALRLFNASHPIFGKVIPDDLDSAMAAGKALGKQFALRKQVEAENAKKIRQAAELGVVMPDGDEEVSSDQASRIMNAIREKRALKGDELAKQEAAELKDWEQNRREKLRAAAAQEAKEEAERMALKAAGTDPDDDEPDYRDCPSCGDEDFDGSWCAECGYNEVEAKAKEAEEAERRAAAEEAIAEARKAPKIEYDSAF